MASSGVKIKLRDSSIIVKKDVSTSSHTASASAKNLPNKNFQSGIGLAGTRSPHDKKTVTTSRNTGILTKRCSSEALITKTGTTTKSPAKISNSSGASRRISLPAIGKNKAPDQKTGNNLQVKSAGSIRNPSPVPAKSNPGSSSAVFRVKNELGKKEQIAVNVTHPRRNSLGKGGEEAVKEKERDGCLEKSEVENKEFTPESRVTSGPRRIKSATPTRDKKEDSSRNDRCRSAMPRTDLSKISGHKGNMGDNEKLEKVQNGSNTAKSDIVDSGVKKQAKSESGSAKNSRTPVSITDRINGAYAVVAAAKKFRDKKPVPVPKTLGKAKPKIGVNNTTNAKQRDHAVNSEQTVTNKESGEKVSQGNNKTEIRPTKLGTKGVKAKPKVKVKKKTKVKVKSEEQPHNPWR